MESSSWRFLEIETLWPSGSDRGLACNIERAGALDSKTFTKYVELLGLTREDMILLFDAIDQDDLGMVNQRNFTDKILPLRGPVPSVNMSRRAAGQAERSC